jgi:hypothetical protein
MEPEQVAQARQRLISLIEQATQLDEELKAAAVRLTEQWMAENDFEARRENLRTAVRTAHLEYELLKNRPVKFALSSS